MKDFKFSCPHCGQHIEADESMAGMAAACPTCSRQLVVPQPQPAIPPKIAQSPPAVPPVIVAQPPPVPARQYAHYIIEKGTLRVVVDSERLESTLNSVEHRFLLDLTEENTKELLRTGRTIVKNLLGGRQEAVTMKGCSCQNMFSHQKESDFHFVG
jgi:DNA-directed RNA polymerase subunit RPC12/RpoP